MLRSSSSVASEVRDGGIPTRMRRKRASSCWPVRVRVTKDRLVVTAIFALLLIGVWLHPPNPNTSNSKTFHSLGPDVDIPLRLPLDVHLEELRRASPDSRIRRALEAALSYRAAMMMGPTWRRHGASVSFDSALPTEVRSELVIRRGAQADVPSIGDTTASCPPGAITSFPARADGFGAQFSAMASIYTWARRSGIPFCTSRWSELTHDHDGTNASHAFDFVGGGSYGAQATDTVQTPDKHLELSLTEWEHGGSSPNASAWDPRVSTMYFDAVALKPPLSWDGSPAWEGSVQRRAARTHLAVHLRRNVASFSDHDADQRLTSNEAVVACVQRALAVMPFDTDVHIFSQGSVEEFGDVRRLPRVNFHLNEPLLTTFHHMVMADALVIAASALSDAAAFLCASRGGRIFMHPDVSRQVIPRYRYIKSGLPIEMCG